MRTITLVIVLLAWILPSAAGQRRALFDVPWIAYETAVYPQGIDPWGARIADFDRDGVPDLATVSWRGTAWLSVLRGDGAGGFAPPQTYPLTLESLDLEAADFDNDGDVDIVVCDTGRLWEGVSVSLFRNDGTGRFAFVGQYLIGENGPSGITAADFNNDGFLDLVTANDDYIVPGNTISLILNNRTGGFQSPRVIVLQPGTRSITSGDIDGDGDPDVVVGHESNRFTIVRNDNGNLTPIAVHPGIPAGSITEYPAVHLADVDRDGDRDVFFSNIDTGQQVDMGAIGLWRNRGDGTLDAPETIWFNVWTGGGVSIRTADVTHDGWPDVLVATGSYDDWFLVPGDGGGRFLPAQRFRAGQFPVSMQSADLDLDGDADVVVVASSSLGACVYLNPGDGGFIQPPTIDMVDPAIAPAFTTNLQAADVDGDQDLDLFIGFRADFAGVHGFSLRRNHGDGTFAAAEIQRTSPYPVAIRLRDMNGDGRPDLLWIPGDFATRFRVRMNRGDGTFGGDVVGPSIGCEPSAIEAEDVDNDGDRDVIVNGCYGEVGVSLNDGGTFRPYILHQTDGLTDTLGLGDFNRDGFLDLLTNSGVQGYAAISNGNGDGSFDPPNTVPTGRDVRAFAVGHVDHDGNLDFAAVYNLDESGLSVRRGRGDGNFFNVRNYYGSYDGTDHTSSLALVDADVDGNLDAMTAAFGAQDFSFWQGNGDGTFQRLTRYGVGQQAYDLAFGDFDRDGVGDVAVTTHVAYGSWWYPGVILLRGVAARNPGDTNCDGVVNSSDIEGFILALFDPAGYGQRYPDCDINNADVNGDGTVNSQDIESFIQLLFG